MELILPQGTFSSAKVSSNCTAFSPKPCFVFQYLTLAHLTAAAISSQVKLLIINSAFVVVQRATAQFKKYIIKVDNIMILVWLMLLQFSSRV
jgi:hypothetical protein